MRTGQVTPDAAPGKPQSQPREASFLVLVRLLLFFALAVIAVAAGLFLLKRDRRYLRFIGQVAKYAILLLLGVLLLYAFERLRSG